MSGPTIYLYADADPLRKTDPLGLWSWDSTVNGQGQISVMVLVAGASISYGQNISSDGKTCRYVQVCPRLGAGAYAGGGFGVGAGVGGTGSTSGWSAGVGGDIGYGASAGAQVTVGPDGIGASGGKIGVGVGFGLSLGIDFCFTKVLECKQVFCPAK